MKGKVLSLISLLFFSICFSQKVETELYRIAFGNKENFKFLTLFGDKIPTKFQIGNETIPWFSDTFYINGLNVNDEKMMEAINNDEHNSYYSTYLFSNLELNSLINDAEKKSLNKQALSQKIEKINIKGKNFETFKKLNKKKQFFFYVTKPIYTSNKEFAFIYIDANKEQYYGNEKPEEYYGYVIVVFRKINNEWKQIAKKDWIIL